MGLNFTKETTYGIDATYWHLARIEHDCFGKSLAVVMNGFIDKDTRVNGGMPFTSLAFTIVPYQPDLSRKEIYELVKVLPEFEGSTDA